MSDRFIQTEQQWRSRAGDACTSILVPAEECLALSRAKLAAVEQAANAEDLAEACNARAQRQAAHEEARRSPLVRELLEETGAQGLLEGQLSALQAEARFLEEERSDERVELRVLERELARSVAARCEDLAAEEVRLSCVLGEELATTGALEHVVARQASILAELSRVEELLGAAAARHA